MNVFVRFALLLCMLSGSAYAADSKGRFQLPVTAASPESYYRDRGLGARTGHSAWHEKVPGCVSEPNTTSLLMEVPVKELV